MQEVILTGLRANGDFHLGNYLGAILPMVELQQRFEQQYQINLFVPDLHSIVTPLDYNSLQANIMQNLASYVASGLDINNDHTFIYRQSFVPAHSELTWILNCFTYFGELGRMTQFKERSEGQANVSVGLFDYPVLMAADILLYNAKWVPVGEDQRQHLELCRDLAMRMNNKFGQLFVVPEEWSKQLEFAQRDSGVRIRSLVNPEKKMSKSVSDPRGTILLIDDPAEATKKVMGATTDSLGQIKFDLKERPGVSNLLQILALLSRREQAAVNAKWEGKTSYGELKTAVAQTVQRFLENFQAKLANVDQSAILSNLEVSEAAMRVEANKVLAHVQKAVGLRG